MLLYDYPLFLLAKATPFIAQLSASEPPAVKNISLVLAFMALATFSLAFSTAILD